MNLNSAYSTSSLTLKILDERAGVTIPQVLLMKTRKISGRKKIQNRGIGGVLPNRRAFKGFPKARGTVQELMEPIKRI
jgi:hypothetical protein